MFVVDSSCKLKHWFKISASFILTKNILASQVCLGTSLSHAPTREMVTGRAEKRWWWKWRREYGRRLKIKNLIKFSDNSAFLDLKLNFNGHFLKWNICVPNRGLKLWPLITRTQSQNYLSICLKSFFALDDHYQFNFCIAMMVICEDLYLWTKNNVTYTMGFEPYLNKRKPYA